MIIYRVTVSSGQMDDSFHFTHIPTINDLAVSIKKNQELADDYWSKMYDDLLSWLPEIMEYIKPFQVNQCGGGGSLPNGSIGFDKIRVTVNKGVI